jgi:hypothetical protein
LRKAALHAAGMLVLIQGLTDVWAGFFQRCFNAGFAWMSWSCRAGCAGVAEKMAPAKVIFVSIEKHNRQGGTRANSYQDDFWSSNKLA